MCSYLGVHHCGKTNPYNLIYDLIEPFRPIIDYYIAYYFEYFMGELTIQMRKELVNLLNANIKAQNQTVSIQYAIDLLVRSYLRSIEYGESELILPSIQKIEFEKVNEFL